jgi:hypothetical protein
VFTVADEHRWFLPWFVDITEARYRADLTALTENCPPDVASTAQWHFGLFAEIILGLLRLRQDEYFATRILAAGSARLLRIARLVRRVDAVLATRGVAVTSSLRLSAQRPESLFRMSELAFALNAFLTGEAGSNLIQIATIEDDEEGQS